MINPHTKVGISVFTHNKDTKGKAKCKSWGGLRLGVTQDYRQCHHSIDCIWLPIRL